MTQRSYVYYGMLGLPLAMVSLPLYVQLPAFYASQFGLSLTSIGYILFAARLLDTAQDPLIGLLINRTGVSNRIWYIGASIVMSCTFAALWSPLSLVQSKDVLLLSWLALMLYLAYSAHSVLNIAYLAWGADLTARNDHRSNVELLGAATWREGFALVGVIIASIVPSLMMSDNQTRQASNFLAYSFVFAAILGLAVFCLLRFAERPRTQELHRQFLSPQKSLFAVIQDSRARPLFIAYLINSLAVALPASLMIFFVEKQICQSEKLPQFLVSYFIAGAIGLPIWLRAAKRFGGLRVWQLSLLISIVAFVGCAFLGAQDGTAYLVICLTSGLCLGADLVLPPVLLAERIRGENQQAAYFGIWTFLGKIALACSGLSLPLMAHLENDAWLRRASEGLIDNIALVLCYALIPCALKCLTFICLIGLRSETTQAL